MLHHFPHQAIDGSWHTVYRRPTTGELQSVLDAPTKRAAQEEADRLNLEQARQTKASAALAVPPAERRLPKGFYTDEDAA